MEGVGERECVGERGGDEGEGGGRLREEGREERGSVVREGSDEVDCEGDWERWEREGERKGERGERGFDLGWESGEGVCCGGGIGVGLGC